MDTKKTWIGFALCVLSFIGMIFYAAYCFTHPGSSVVKWLPDLLGLLLALGLYYSITADIKKPSPADEEAKPKSKKRLWLAIPFFFYFLFHSFTKIRSQLQGGDSSWVSIGWDVLILCVMVRVILKVIRD